MPTKKLDFKMGADPEFALVTRRDHLKYATDVFNGNDRNANQFGLDGSGIVMEIRPTPDYNPIKVVKNIREAMMYGIANQGEVAKYNWKAGSSSDHEATGGHIHFGTSEMDPAYGWRSVKPLDVYLAQTCLLLEEPSEAQARRMHSGYGKLSDFRSQAHGMEYRSLGSWLTSPYVAAGVLCLAKAIVYEIVNNDLKSSSIPSSKCMTQDQFDEDNRGAAVKMLERNWPDIQKMELYAKYSGYIDFLKILIDKNMTWYPRCGMKAAWGLTVPTLKEEVAKEIPMVVFRDIWGV